MRTIHKFLISLLVSIVLLGLFIVLGYTGLFETIETKFYNQRIIEIKRERIDDIYHLFTDYNNENFSRLSLVLNNNSFHRVFELNQKAEDIIERDQIVGSLEDELKGFQYLRIIDFTTDSQKIHFSSDKNDIRSSTSSRIIYDLWRNSSDFNEDLVYKTLENTIEFKESNSSIIYKIPMKDSLGLDKGLALIYFSSSGFKEYLFAKGLSSSNSLIQLSGTNGILIDLKREQLAEVEDRLQEIQESNLEQPHLISSDTANERFFILNKKITDYKYLSDLNISIVIKESELQLNPILIIVLLTLIFSTFFLIIFLILNIPQDKSVVIASRIKKFQLNFLIEYLDNKSDLNWDMWERDMRSRRDQVRKEFKKGLGRFQKEEEKDIDKLIDNNWDEIISVLSKKKEEKEESKDFDLKKIEQILQKALKNVNFTVPAGSVLPASTEPVKKGKPEPVEVEDLSDEEGLEDLEDLG
ncbi:MAG: hypothetical protein JEY91_02600, partial [Spirochaetaceae bacterium]|nr:hypothetical protein [Spirochaetaceae bacterium]